MASNTIRQRALPSLLHPVRSVPFAMRATATPYQGHCRCQKDTSTATQNLQCKRWGEKLTEEQKREVDEHNKDFEKKHDTAAPADKDKVDKKFWSNRDSGM
ncbi:hypothetical protein ColLi_03374 [Colletotrichum liriopes]|uniref:Uncharacterized protein n=1 Tax=Colletotrichum liriopes TaxID=708192 RepID=A0AA37GGJ1_9PEZI|nr:hypothetical protein ColLi_03374 [Colletotrichum liriopes]